MLIRRAARGAIGDLTLREDALKEHFPVFLDHLGNPNTFDDIGAQADDLSGWR